MSKKVTFSYHDVPITGRTVMATRQERESALLNLYPDYSINTDESVLWNWIEAVAQVNGVDHESARQVLAEAQDPIFGGPKANEVGRWVFYLA